MLSVAALLPLYAAFVPLPTPQSNAVAGLDVELGLLGPVSTVGRAGAFPNGRVAFSASTTACNPGEIPVPWFAAMDERHPTIAFLVAREVNGRFEQISGYSWVKHGFFAAAEDACNQGCNGPTGPVLALGCSDTYGSGVNSDRFWLAPAEEIDPWLGAWNPVGSHFDAQPVDGARDFNGGAPDSVSGRITIQDQDLLVPGANFYYQGYYTLSGEAETRRGNNLGWRPISFNHNGSQWTSQSGGTQNLFSNGEQRTVLHAWNGARVFSGTNGASDGRVHIGCRTSAASGGQTHYEYALHNRDNARGVAEIRLPLAPGTNISNFEFSDIDDDATNDWTASVIGSELVITQNAGNPLRWNSIYSFGFDANALPATNAATLVAFAGGPGASSFECSAVVPGGSALAACDRPDDFFEPNNSCAVPARVVPGTQVDLLARAGDDDWFTIQMRPGWTLEIGLEFEHARGDLDLSLFEGCGSSQIAASTGNTDVETLTFTNTTPVIRRYRWRVALQPGASGCNDYQMRVEFPGAPPGNLIPLCFGDGSGAQCPCNNNSTAGHRGGCAHQFGDGAILSAFGAPSLSSDSMEFQLTGAKPISFALLLSGDSSLPPSGPCVGCGNPIFDGLRCTGGNLRRHGTRPIDSNGDAVGGWDSSNGGILVSSGFFPGRTRYFTVFFRTDPAATCGTGQSASNAIEVLVGL